jgi:hypothetical protein
MKFQERKFLYLALIGLMGLGGCEAPHGGRYNNAVYDAPSYDADVYMPKYAIQPSYDHSYYHEDIYRQRG